MGLEKIVRAVSSVVLVGGFAAFSAGSVMASNLQTWEKSSLEFTAGCSGNCDSISARVCNTGDGDMTGPVGWQLYFAESGNPKDGSQIDSGSLGPLDKGECEVLSYSPAQQSGNYMWRVEQEAGHPGSGELWSDACNILCEYTPTPTNTPEDTPTPTNTPEDTPTPTNTPEDTPTPTNTPEDTPTPTNTPEDTPTPTNTPEDTFTPTLTYTPGTPTKTPKTKTPTDTPETPTKTKTPTQVIWTPTWTPTFTKTSTPVYVQTITPQPPAGGAMDAPYANPLAGILQYGGLGMMGLGAIGVGATYKKRN